MSASRARLLGLASGASGSWPRRTNVVLAHAARASRVRPSLISGGERTANCLGEQAARATLRQVLAARPPCWLASGEAAAAIAEQLARLAAPLNELGKRLQMTTVAAAPQFLRVCRTASVPLLSL